ncbi:hypothetical protein BDP55DRAFT_230598 [Colletotrichum godetiae]|uniref:Uncharacterized protein n=1 Tax=Colletotrichum godetiae TaxID=1209918 RepID=A0AAJ0AIG2_9PEZI|nr:uncharacterized protein BDP55DRAFT_230598 [Colletotrichum godetiae]KAK1673048.1 hypothetical protein BDP55DRAFT_230598 [Colletotrichum godetiae]
MAPRQLLYLWTGISTNFEAALFQPAIFNRECNLGHGTKYQSLLSRLFPAPPRDKHFDSFFFNPPRLVARLSLLPFAPRVPATSTPIASVSPTLFALVFMLAANTMSTASVSQCYRAASVTHSWVSDLDGNTPRQR